MNFLDTFYVFGRSHQSDRSSLLDFLWQMVRVNSDAKITKQCLCLCARPPCARQKHAWGQGQPYQCISMDSSFSGMASKDKTRRSDIEGINGGASWVLVQDRSLNAFCTPGRGSPPLRVLCFTSASTFYPNNPYLPKL